MKRDQRVKKYEKNLKDTWNTVKISILCVIGISEWKERENGTDEIFEEMMVENFQIKERHQVIGGMHTMNPR